MNGHEKEFLGELGDLIREHGTNLTVMQIIGVLDLNRALLVATWMEKYIGPTSKKKSRKQDASHDTPEKGGTV